MLDRKLLEHMDDIIERIEYFRRRGKRSITFVRYYNSFQIEADQWKEKLKKHARAYEFKYIEYRVDWMYDAFDPILTWIRELYEKFFSQMEAEQFLEECGIYPLHRKMLVNYFERGVCEREEDILVNEVSYDRKQFVLSLVQILDYISSRKKVCFIIAKLHFAPNSVLHLLEQIILSEKCHKLVIIAGYNELYTVPTYKQNCWGRILELANKEKMVLEWEVRQKTWDVQGTMEVFTPNRQDLEEYEDKLYNMMMTLSLEDARYYASILRRFFDVDAQGVDEHAKMKFMSLSAYICIYRGDYKSAFQLCEKIHKNPLYEKDIMCRYERNKILVLAKVYGGQRESAFKNVTCCNELAMQSGQEDKIFESHVLQCIIEMAGWKDITLHKKRIHLPDHFEENAKKYHWMNHLSYIYIFGFSEDLMERIEDMQDPESYFEHSVFFKRGMEVAEELQNDELKLCAWQKIIMLASAAGHFEVMQYFYQKILEVLKYCKRENDEAQMYNGNGYYCTVREEFEQANQYYKKAIDIFLRIGNPEGLCESLYNSAINCMNIGDYRQVEHCLRIVLDVMKLTGMERIRVANRSKLYGMLIICYIQMNRMYDAKLYLDKMQDIMRHILQSKNPNYDMWEDDMFLYYAIKAILAKSEENYHTANEMFEQAERIWRMQPMNQFYVFGVFAWEALELYQITGEQDKYNRMMQLALQYFESTRQAKKAEKFLKKVQKGTFPAEHIRTTISKEQQKKIMEMIQFYALNQEVDNKKKAMMFFENWVELLNCNNDSIDSMIETAMSTMENNYNIDRLIYLDVNSGLPKVRYYDKNLPISGIQIKGVVQYFSNNLQNVVTSRFDSDYDRYRDLTEIFGANEIFSMIGIPIVSQNKRTNILIAIRTRHENFTQGIVPFREEELEIFRTTFRQLLDAIERENVKQQLEIRSVTDLLTGLLNRQGLKKKMENLLQGYGQTLTVLYLDLDNFKYCNDHFGHETGDVVLIAFSRLLEAIGGYDSVITRYGGDEFLMVLPNRDVADGIEVAEEILRTLEEKQGFLQDIKESYKVDMNNTEIYIAKENQITCSIGIASDICMNYSDINGILMKADKALYEVKNSTKADYAVWQ